MAAKFPKPEFFRAKNNMDWKKQAENLKSFSMITDVMLPPME